MQTRICNAYVVYNLVMGVPRKGATRASARVGTSKGRVNLHAIDDRSVTDYAQRTQGKVTDVHARMGLGLSILLRASVCHPSPKLRASQIRSMP